MQAAQMCAFDSLQLEDQATKKSGAAAAGGDDADADNGAGNGFLRHLTPAQRASMSIRTFNLRWGFGREQGSN